MGNGTNSLYVNDSGLRNCVDDLERWKKDFNETDRIYKEKINHLNELWVGSDYDAAKKRILDELDKITGENGKIQSFVTECTNELTQKVNDYQSIRQKNQSYWEEQ